MTAAEELPDNNYDEARRWLKLASQDLASARHLHQPELSPRYPTMWAHQAAEKAVKAVLIDAEVPFRKLHDLGALFDLLPVNAQRRFDRPQLDRLTPWAIDGRYEEELVEGTHEIAIHMLAVASAAVDAATGILDGEAG